MPRADARAVARLITFASPARISPSLTVE